MMSEDRVCKKLERLRSPQRRALLEIDRVVDLSLENMSGRDILDIGTGGGGTTPHPPA